MFGKKIVVKIDGMSCSHCAKRVEEGLKKIDNVKSVKVDLNNKKATVTYKDSIDTDMIEKTINELEYEFKGIE